MISWKEDLSGFKAGDWSIGLFENDDMSPVCDSLGVICWDVGGKTGGFPVADDSDKRGLVGGALAGKGALIGNDDKIDGTAGAALLGVERGRAEVLVGAEFGTGDGTGAGAAC